MNRLVKKLLIGAAVTLVLLVLTAYGLLELTASRSFQFFGGAVTHADTAEKVVALTFDDGPTEKTDEILSILEAEGVKATFFLTGQEMERHPELANKLVFAGHEIGNHSYSHKRMVFRSPAFVRREIERTDEIIRSLGYTGPIPFRPPYGRKLLVLPHYLKEQERKTIMWNVEPEDVPEIRQDPQRIADYTVEQAKPGSIILLHVMYPGREATMQSVQGIISGLRAKGYEFRTVSELLGE